MLIKKHINLLIGFAVAILLSSCHFSGVVHATSARLAEDRPDSTIGPSILGGDEDWIEIELQFNSELAMNAFNKGMTVRAEFTDCNNRRVHVDEIYVDGKSLDLIRLRHFDMTIFTGVPYVSAETYVPRSIYGREP
jgi:hypothetical protein